MSPGRYTSRRFSPPVPATSARLLPIRPLTGWLMLGASVAVYLVVSKLMHQPFHLGGRNLRFFDLRVYRGAAERMLHHGSRLYGTPILDNFGFTYPPAAALLLTPLGLASLPADRIIVSAINLLLLLWVVHVTLALGGVRAGGARRLSLIALLAAGALWLEPVSVTFGYGQIDLLITGLVVYDLALDESAPHAGVAIGLAAGIKLTPLLFIVYLALAGRRRAALVSLLSFLATIAVSLICTGHDTLRYWTSLIFESSRVGTAGDAANQSLRGALARLVNSTNPGAWVDLIAVLVAVLGLYLAVRASRRGQPGLGFSLTAVTTLLISPVSWTHHWCLAVPALVLIGLEARRRGSRPLALATIVCAAVGFAYLPELYLNSADSTISGLSSIGDDSYVLLGLAILAAAAVSGGPLGRGAGNERSDRPVDTPDVPRPPQAMRPV